MFLHLCFSHSVHRGVSATPPLGRHISPGQTSPGQTPPGQTPSWADTPRQIPPGRHPLGQTPLGRHLPGQKPPGRYPLADTPLGRLPLGRHPLSRTCWDRYPHAHCMLGYTSPAQWMLGYSQQAGGTHPTGMHSFNCCLQQVHKLQLGQDVWSEEPAKLHPSIVPLWVFVIWEQRFWVINNVWNPGAPHSEETCWIASRRRDKQRTPWESSSAYAYSLPVDLLLLLKVRNWILIQESNVNYKFRIHKLFA